MRYNPALSRVCLVIILLKSRIAANENTRTNCPMKRPATYVMSNPVLRKGPTKIEKKASNATTDKLTIVIDMVCLSLTKTMG